MTLKQFFDKYNGKLVEFDGVHPNQCVDLIKAYVTEVLNIPTWTGDPKDYKEKIDPRYMLHKSNTPLYIPPAGSIAIWNGNVGNGHGHAGIVTHAQLMSFVSFDQNWPKGSPSVLINHNYRNVTGFLIKRGQDILSQYNALATALKDLTDKFPLLSE